VVQARKSKERYPRVARDSQITYDSQAHAVRWQEDTARTERATRLDGSYALKTDRTEWTGWVLACHPLVFIEKIFLAAAA